MEWTIASIVVVTASLWMNLWWIPRYDAIGIGKAKRVRLGRLNGARDGRNASSTKPPFYA